MLTPSRSNGLIGGGLSCVRNEQRFIRSEKSGSKTRSPRRRRFRATSRSASREIGDQFQADSGGRRQVVDHHLGPRLRAGTPASSVARVEVHDRDAQPLVGLLAEPFAEREAQHEDQQRAA